MKSQITLLIVGFLVLLGAIWLMGQHNSSAIVDGTHMTTMQLYWRLTGIALCFFGVFFVVHYLRGRSALKRWAHQNGLQILKSKLTSSFAGSFTWNHNQTIYFIQVRDREGNVRDGWVRCGSFWLGVLSSKTEVRWKDEL
jgi:hypothetical protein